jgi:hypothetical protein
MPKPVSKKLRAMLSLAKSAPSRIDQAKRRKTYEDKSIDLDMGRFRYKFRYN